MGRPARLCPCCGHSTQQFAPGGPSRRPDARCVRCGSLERHRLLWLLLVGRPRLFTGRVLHVAAEPIIARRLRSTARSYLSIDLAASSDARMDITCLALPEHSQDAVVASHVLEHVPDDRRALQEIRRVLASGGIAVLHVPQDVARESTDEDPDVTDPAERVRRFGQDDHVRLYGRDFVPRVEAAGFRVESWGGHLGPRRRQRFGLADEVVYLATPA